MDESTINEWYSFYLFEYQLFISDMITLFCLELITPFFVNVFFSFSIYLLCDTLQLYQMACPIGLHSIKYQIGRVSLLKSIMSDVIFIKP